MATEGLSAPIALSQPQPPNQNQQPVDASNQQGLSAPIALPAPPSSSPAPVEPVSPEASALPPASSPGDGLGPSSSLPAIKATTETGLSQPIDTTPQEDVSYLTHPGKWVQDTISSMTSAVPDFVKHPVNTVEAVAPYFPKAVSEFEGAILQATQQAFVAGAKKALGAASEFDKAHGTPDTELQQAATEAKNIKVENEPIYQAGASIIDHWQLSQEQQLKSINSLGNFGSTAVDTLSSFVPYIAADAVGGPITTAALSSIAGSGQQLQDAVAHKATDDQKQAASTWGAILGASYLIPVHLALGRLAEVPGGSKFTKAMADYLQETPWLQNLAQKLDNPLTRVGGTAAVTALQQAAITVGNNLVARDFAGYDPNRDPFEGLRVAVQGGVGAGTIMAFMVEAMRRGGAPIKVQQPIEEPPAAPAAKPQEAPAPVVPPFDSFAHRTSLILEQFADAHEVNFSALKQAAARIGGGEQKLVNETLSKFEGQKTVNVQQFKMALQNRFLDIRTSSFYGPETVGKVTNPDTGRVEAAPHGQNLYGDVGLHILKTGIFNSIVHVHKAPYVNLEGTIKSTHYSQFPDYYAHSRGAYSDGIPHIYEIQSDIAGKRAPEYLDRQVKKAAETVSTNEQAASLVKGIDLQDAAKLQDPYYMKQAAREVMRIHAAKGDSVIRFAAPETVAEAESWIPGKMKFEEAKAFIKRGEDIAAEMKKQLATIGISYQEYRRDVENPDETSPLSPDQQHAYDELTAKSPHLPWGEIAPRSFTKLFAAYEKFSKWLKENGATDVTDSMGNHWHEIALDPSWANAAQVQFEGLGLGFIAREHIARVEAAFDRSIPPPKEPAGPEDLGGPNGSPPDRPIREDLDKFSYGMKILDTMQMVYEKNRNVPVLGDILQKHWKTLSNWWQLSLNWKYRGEQTIRSLYKTIPYRQRKQLYDFIAELGAKSHSERKRFEIGSPEFVELAKRHGLNESHIAWYDRMDHDFQSVVVALKDSASKELAKLYLPDNQASYNIQMHKLETLFKPLFNVNFIPFTRFGKRVVSAIAQENFVDATGREWKPGETVDMEAVEGPLVETQVKFLLARKKREFTNKPVTVVAGRLSDKHFSWQMLPVEMQEILRSELGLNQDQQSALADMLAQLSPTQSFARHLISRKGTPGFSRDIPRAYAEYMGRFGNHISRLTYGGDLRDTIKQVSDSALQMRYEGLDNNKRIMIHDHLNDHYNYIMNRENEWAGARAIAFLWYLSFLPKTALVNALQPTMFTYPYLAAKYGTAPGIGDVKALSAITKAYKNLTESKFNEIFDRVTKDASMVFPNPKVIEPDLAEALYRFVKDGTLDQSIATEIAAAQRGSLLDKTSIGSAVGSGMRKVAEYGAWPFQKMEILNRYVTAIAAWRMGKKAMENALGRRFKDWTPAEREALYNDTKEAVQKTQFEYAFWNRPRYAWGKRSSMFVFTMYTRNSLYFYRHTSGRGRALAILLALGGVAGLPFAQDIENFLDFMMNSDSGRKLIGIPPGKFWNTNMLLHEYLNTMLGKSSVAKELGINTPEMTELLMHGASHKYGLGPLVALRNLGIPVPYTDVSSSLSLGNVIPGSRLPLDIQSAIRGQESVPELIGNTVKGGTGVLGSLASNFLSGLTGTLSSGPRDIKNFEQLAPHFISNELKAGEAAYNGAYTTNSGMHLADVDTKNPADVAELVAYGLGGFTPTRLAEGQEKYYAEQMSIRFYESQRRILLANLAQAVYDKNPEEKEAARTEIKRFNASAPKNLYIIGQSQIDAIQSKARLEADKAKGERAGKIPKAAANFADEAFQAPPP